MSKLYYTPPLEKEFNELKEKAIEIWAEYDNTFGYASEKINAIKDIKNISDNFMYIVAMFDYQNQKKLLRKLTEETKQSVDSRIIDGGGNSILKDGDKK